MFKKLIILTCFLTWLAPASPWHRLWQVSSGVLIGATTLDGQSSWGKQELNPILGQGTFGMRQAFTLEVLPILVISSEWMLTRKYPSLEKPFAIANFIGGGIHVGCAVHNWRLSK